MVYWSGVDTISYWIIIITNLWRVVSIISYNQTYPTTIDYNHIGNDITIITNNILQSSTNINGLAFTGNLKRKHHRKMSSNVGALSSMLFPEKKRSIDIVQQWNVYMGLKALTLGSAGMFFGFWSLCILGSNSWFCEIECETDPLISIGAETLTVLRWRFFVLRTMTDHHVLRRHLAWWIPGVFCQALDSRRPSWRFLTQTAGPSKEAAGSI